MKAHIRKAKGNGLWLIIDKDEKTEGIKQALNIDEPGFCSWAILPEEVELIRDACNEWLEKRGEK